MHLYTRKLDTCMPLQVYGGQKVGGWYTCVFPNDLIFCYQSPVGVPVKTLSS